MSIYSERGAALVAGMACCMGSVLILALVVDQGIIWVSRTQCQAVADAGALAGAVTLVNPTGTEEEARSAAEAVIELHRILQARPVVLRLDVGVCPPRAPSAIDRCVNVRIAHTVPRLFGTVGMVVEAPASATVLEAPDTRGGPTPIRYVALVR